MKNRKTLTTLTALVIGLSSTLAMADPPHGRGHRDEQRHGQRDNRHDNRHGDRHDSRYDRDDRRGPGVGPDRHWHRGDRLPPQYRVRQVVVQDWRGHHLHAPPRGHQWVQVGADYALIAIATGVIAQLILSN